MDHSIDYSSLPTQPPSVSHRRKLRLLLLVLLGAFIIIHPFILLRYPVLDTIIVGAELIVLAMLLMLWLGARRGQTERMYHQQDTIRVFAERNGWQFEGPKPLTHRLPSSQNPADSSIQQQYYITGRLHNQDFELFAAGNKTYLRTQGPLSKTLVAQSTQLLSDDGSNYVVMNGIAATVDDMKALLQPLLGAPNT